MLLDHLDGILNYCRTKVPFGVVEAINGNIKTLLRRGVATRISAIYCSRHNAWRSPRPNSSFFRKRPKMRVSTNSRAEPQKEGYKFSNCGCASKNEKKPGGCMHGLTQNLRFALRQLSKAPGFTVTAVLALALGIGATTAIFSLVEAVLLRPLPFKDSDRLVLLGDHLGGRPGISVRAREIATYTNATEAFSSLGGYITAAFELSGEAQPEEISAARLNSATFPTLGVEPILGRVFTPQEEDTQQSVTVISYALWTNHYHRDPRVLGSTMILDRKPYSVIGVMPRDFEFPLELGRLDQAQVWVPLSLTPDELSDQHSGFWGYHMIARLKDGVTLSQGAQDADRVAHQIMRDFPASMSAIQIQGDVKQLRETVVADVRPVLRTLFVAVAVVLLVACVNVSSLMLVRAIRQRREYAVRAAIGASSTRIICESAVEGVLLSVAGGLLGLAFAAIAIRTALHLVPDSMPRINSVSVNPFVASFALFIAVASGVLCSFAPAFAALRTNLVESLKEGTQAASGSASHSWLRSSWWFRRLPSRLCCSRCLECFCAACKRCRKWTLGSARITLWSQGISFPFSNIPPQLPLRILTARLWTNCRASPE